MPFSRVLPSEFFLTPDLRIGDALSKRPEQSGMDEKLADFPLK